MSPTLTTPPWPAEWQGGGNDEGAERGRSGGSGRGACAAGQPCPLRSNVSNRANTTLAYTTPLFAHTTLILTQEHVSGLEVSVEDGRTPAVQVHHASSDAAAWAKGGDRSEERLLLPGYASQHVTVHEMASAGPSVGTCCTKSDPSYTRTQTHFCLDPDSSACSYSITEEASPTCARWAAAWLAPGGARCLRCGAPARPACPCMSNIDCLRCGSSHPAHTLPIPDADACRGSQVRTEQQQQQADLAYRAPLRFSNASVALPPSNQRPP